SHESGAGYQARLPSAQRTGPHVTCSGDLGLAALQHIPGSNQRAAPLLFEVLGFSAAEIATMTATSTTSVNSALARARKIVAEKVPSRTQQQTLRQFGDARVREIVTSYATALQRGDTDALVALLTEDVTWSMPPLPHWYHGIEAVTDFAVRVPLPVAQAGATCRPARTASRPWRSTLATTVSGPHRAWSITVWTQIVDLGRRRGGGAWMPARTSSLAKVPSTVSMAACRPTRSRSRPSAAYWNAEAAA